jgi:hypothetical protein
MQDLYVETKKKVQYLKKEGYNIVEKWECDLKRELNEDGEMRRHFEEHSLVDPLQPREAFFGGRTNAAKLFHKCENGERIKYVDFTSLYPWCNKSTRMVVGHPEIITENFEDISAYFGLIKCTVLPPRGLFHPVLPYRTPGKLTFPLCKACVDTTNQNTCTHTDSERAILGTWCHIELLKALEKGYQILQLHEVWHFPKQSEELFKGYVDTFLKIKQEASGYPKDRTTPEQKQAYIDEYLEHEGIALDPEKIVHNPGLRALSKLMLNSFWGKCTARRRTPTLYTIFTMIFYFR